MDKHQLRREGGFTEIGILIIALVLLGAAGIYAYQTYQSKQAVQPTAAVQVVPAIAKAAFASELDATGAAKAPATTFAPTTPVIYAVATVSKTGQKARIEYIRFLNNKFVDNGSMSLAKLDAKNASFAFKLNPGATRPAGTYTVKFYANGRYIRQAAYTVQ